MDGRLIRLSLGLLLALVLVIPTMAKEPKPKKEKEAQISGRVQMIAKDSSTITLAKGNVNRQVVYSADTKFEYGSSRSSKASSIDQVKEGNYMYCGGKLDGVKLMASKCRFREQK